MLGAFVREDINGHPREVHLLVSPGPNVKLLAQDVRDLLEERLAVEVDHRVISIAQLAEDLVDEPLSLEAPDSDKESRIRFVNVVAEVREQRVRVAARFEHDETILEGEGVELDVGTGRLRAAATATLRAISDRATEQIRLELDSISIVRAFDREYVLVCVMAGSGAFGRKLLQLVGSQPIEHDPESAAAMATLKAVNRVIAKVLP